MRLVYIYIDFTIGGKNPDGYRNYKKCGLNFGTEYYFNMSEPSEDKPNYELKCSARPAGERIEPGFWGNDRLYNISALVGDNGVGKSTIIHEIIRCLHSSSFKNKRTNSLCAILMQDHTGKYYLHHSLSTPIMVSLDASDRMHLDDNLQQLTNNGTPISANAFVSKNLAEDCSIKIHPLIEKSKIIYFSNALTLSDQRLFETFHDIDSASNYETLQYTRPLYDCSLIADMISAIRISHASNDTISKHFNTYFNFRSYQEARYLFDRNQRETLKKLKTKYEYPVPVPKNLNIHISPSIPRLYNFLVREKIEFHENNNKELIKKEFDVFRDSYDEFLKQSAKASVIIAELCLNCIACFMFYVGEYYGHESIQIPRIPLDFNQSFFLEFLKSLCPEDKTNNDTAKKTKRNLYNCQDYITNLWNNKNIIELYCKDVNISITEGVTFNVTLGDNIDKILVEFMIRFINLTRAVSIMDYFVIYNWGLSSGESNLLHLFTKLRYILTGNCYDSDTPTDEITIENADSTPRAKRHEELVNYFDHDRMEICDSVIIFIDEADLTLHPDWQRQFVAILASFLPELFLNPYHEDTTKGCNDIQIILGTHSPIMLGDFPAASVIYLQETKDGTISANDRNSMQPFGQNIYTILQNGFYLQNGTFGELARQKIMLALDDIHAIRHSDSIKPDDAKKLMKQLNSHLRLTVQYLPEGAIKNKLTEEISISKAKLKSYIPCEDSTSTASSVNSERIRQLEKENAELKYQLLKLQNKESLNDPN